MPLTNPYAKPNPLAKPLYNTKPVSAGGVTVETKKPVLVEPAPTAPGKTAGFWAKKTNKQKMMFLGVGVVAVVAIIAFSKKK